MSRSTQHNDMYHRPVRWLLCIGVLAACSDDEVAIPPECNGSIELCGRRFDEVAYATTHNGMSNAADGWTYPNQNFGIDRQLADGVRALMLDIHEWGDDVLLCHGPCPLGSLPLVDGLALIRRFLRTHRGEVVTIILESYVPAPRVAALFETAELAGLVHAPPPGAPWHTLRELIDQDERLIVLTDDESGQATSPWYMHVWAHAFENPYKAATVAEFSCDLNRGDVGNPLFILNHFLSDPLAQPDDAPVVNANPFLIERAMTCMAARAHLPNFISVDFYDQGDVLAAVRTLNGL